MRGDLKKGTMVHFKLKKSFRHPRCTGIVESSPKKSNLVWITLKEVQGEKVKENKVCVHKRNIF